MIRGSYVTWVRVDNLNEAAIVRVGDTAHLRCESLIVSVQTAEPDENTELDAAMNPPQAQAMNEQPASTEKTSSASGNTGESPAPTPTPTHFPGQPNVQWEKTGCGASGRRIGVHRFSSQAIAASSVLHIGSVGTVTCISGTYSNTN